jgi:predicted transposase YdaD
VARYRALFRQQYVASDIRALFRLIEHLLRLDPVLARQALEQMHQAEVEETGMDTFVSSVEEIGREEGRVEGRIEGQNTERRDLVLRQLDRKVGPLSDDLQARVTACTPTQLLDLSEALLDFASQASLIAWLNQHAGASDA